MKENDINKIEDVKMHPYDPNDKSMGHQREGVLRPITHKVNEEWVEDQILNANNMTHKFKKKPISISKKFFLASIIFFVGALGFAFYKFYNNDVSISNDKINIEVIGNAFAKGGEELSLQVEITNNNNANLELAYLIVEYPKRADDISTDVIRLPRDSIGTIRPGESVMRNIEVRLFGEENALRNIKINLEYHPEGSNAIFSKEVVFPITINLAPLSIEMEAPSNITSDQPITLKVTATLNTSLPDENPILQVNYPNNFIFDEAVPAPILGNSIWDLSALSIGNPMVFEIKGRLVGQNGEEQVFHAYAGTTDGMNQSKVNIVYSSILQKILISKPFLDVRILVNSQDKKEYSVSGGREVNAEIVWVNNLPTRITDAQIIVNLSGNVYSKDTLKPNTGFYDSVNNQIIWDKNMASKLGEINPGESGSVTFSFTPTSIIGVSSVKDPQISVKVSIKGRQPLQGSTYADINNFSEKIVKVLTDFQIAASATYYSGSMPPKAETETKYIVTWTLSNSANTVTGAVARAYLAPIYVKWVGLPPGENKNITYNDVTHEVIWDIGQVLPNTGISSNNEVSFIVSLNPSTNQIGSVLPLMSVVSLSGTDTFTNTLVKSKFGIVTTSLRDNPNYKPIDSRVSE